MLLFWLLARERFSASTGWLERYFTFVCEQCGGSLAAMARVSGTARASTYAEAERKANAAADGMLYRVTIAAACPCCGKSTPQLVEAIERAAKRQATRLRWRWLAAALVALLGLVIAGCCSAADLRYSAWSLVGGVFTTLAAAALAFLTLSLEVAQPLLHPTGLWFSHDPARGPEAWFPAQGAPPPSIPAPTSRSRALSGVSLVVAGALAIGAFVMWGKTFRKIYVINAASPTTFVAVTIDGERVGTVSNRAPTTSDAPYGEFTVRTNRDHEVRISGQLGAERVYTVMSSEAGLGSSGWVIAPDGFEQGLCLAQLHWYYGTQPIFKSKDAVLNDEDEDVVVLPTKFDVVLTAPPQEMRVDSSGKTLTTLRALECKALARGDIVRFGDARPRGSSL